MKSLPLLSFTSSQVFSPLLTFALVKGLISLRRSEVRSRRSVAALGLSEAVRGHVRVGKSDFAVFSVEITDEVS